MVLPGGAVIPSAHYDGYCQRWGTPVASPYGAQGRYGGYTDSETGMVYGSGSYYAPTIGRFTQPNAIGFSSGGNPYASYGSPSYVEEDPDAWVGLPRNFHGQQFYYDGFKEAVNKGSQLAEEGLNFAAHLNPLAAAVMTSTGEDAAGRKLGKTQRIILGIGVILAPMNGLRGTASGIGHYGRVGGHHIHQKAAFRGIATYHPDKAMAISQAYMNIRGWSHAAMSARQRGLFDDLYEAVQAGLTFNTMREHNRIAFEALRAGAHFLRKRGS